MVNLYLDSAERPKIQSSDLTTHIAYAREALRKSFFSFSFFCYSAQFLFIQILLGLDPPFAGVYSKYSQTTFVFALQLIHLLQEKRKLANK